MPHKISGLTSAMKTLVFLIAVSCCAAELLPTYGAPWFLQTAKFNSLPLAGNGDESLAYSNPYLQPFSPYLTTSYHYQHQYSPNPFLKPFNHLLNTPFGFSHQQQLNNTFRFPYGLQSPYGFPYGHHLNNPYAYPSYYPLSTPFGYSGDDYLPPTYDYNTESYLHTPYSYNPDLLLKSPYNYALTNQLISPSDFPYGELHNPLTFSYGYHLPTPYGFPKSYSPFHGIFKQNIFPFGRSRVFPRRQNMEASTPVTQDTNNATARQ